MMEEPSGEVSMASWSLKAAYFWRVAGFGIKAFRRFEVKG